MNIVLCDDDNEYRTKLEYLIEGILIRNSLDITIALSTGNPDDVISYIEKNNSVTLYFLDISFGGEAKGMELANTIRSKDDISQIVFITNYPDNMPLTFEYKLKALDFITKFDNNDCRHKIEECINLVEKRQKIGYDNCLNIHNYNNSFSVAYENILYIDTIPGTHKLVLHTESSVHQFYGKITDILHELDDRFLRCHRAVIVNEDKIIGADKHDRLLILSNGASCPYSVVFFNPDAILESY